ncbi:MAG: acetylxylan esterase [Pseudomonadota bacterium]
MSTVRWVSPPRPADVDYDEARVPPFELPDVLVASDGTRIASAEAWRARRRPELLELFSREVYGRTPPPVPVRVAVASVDEQACFGLVTRRELDVTVGEGDGSAVLRVLVFVPRGARGPVPAFLGINLLGNHTVHPDPKIRLATGWVPQSPETGIPDHEPTEASRGMHARRWPVELLAAAGYALVTVYAGDIDPDHPYARERGVRYALRDALDLDAGDAWGAISAWAYGLSRVLDALEQLPEIDAARVAVIGHSRFGKAALWAAARDERFALAVASGSGCAGAKLSRRRFGERVAHITTRFPHWFCKNFHAYADREDALPFDQHALLALLAPRPVYIASAEQDLWADPKGELLACLAASPVYALFGRSGIDVSPEAIRLNVSYGNHIGYHRRPGGHDILAADFWHVLAFARRHAIQESGASH